MGRERVNEICRGPGKTFFMLMNGFIFVLAAALAGALIYTVTTYQSLLEGSFFFFLFPGAILSLVLMVTNVLGCLAVKRGRRAFVIMHILLMVALSLAAIFTALMLLILSGYVTDLPFFGEYFGGLGEQFEIQVFNECCVLGNENKTINQCGQPTIQDVCFEADNKWENLVSPELCEALEEISDTSFVTPNKTGTPCGDEDGKAFIESFAGYIDENLELVTLGMLVFSVFVLIATITAIFQCCALEKGAGRRASSNVLDNPNFGGGKNGAFFDPSAGADRSDNLPPVPYRAPPPGSPMPDF